MYNTKVVREPCVDDTGARKKHLLTLKIKQWNKKNNYQRELILGDTEETWWSERHP